MYKQMLKSKNWKLEIILKPRDKHHSEMEMKTEISKLKLNQEQKE